MVSGRFMYLRRFPETFQEIWHFRTYQEVSGVSEVFQEGDSVTFLEGRFRVFQGILREFEVFQGTSVTLQEGSSGVIQGNFRGF